jgi:hypothetical protein
MTDPELLKYMEKLIKTGMLFVVLQDQIYIIEHRKEMIAEWNRLVALDKEKK